MSLFVNGEEVPTTENLTSKAFSGVKNLNKDSDLNNLSPGIWYCSGLVIKNSPYTTKNWYLVVVFSNYYQLILSTRSDIQFRCKTGYPMAWVPWNHIGGVIKSLYIKALSHFALRKAVA
ncbi:hypothetical protein J2Z60_000183 [Lactobacillus colini]|uniref:Uncharacterized protein n=1 Tax=Lactobacillus colini TaxID=1819254 RepID=A0ABS4MBG6_9LACO|nr:hypothetical protein [Lactobacillus colini]MBP2057021.1 hypothetical protein [Lactobacillus colini]